MNRDYPGQFSTMIDSGLPLVQCLDIQAKQAENPTFREELGVVKEAVESGSTFADAVRSGQRVQRPTDHIATYKGGVFRWSFSDYAVENEAALQMLLQLVSEDDSPSGTVAITGNQGTVAYEEGSSTGEYACVVISNPDADEDRLMHSSILETLTLTLNPTVNGGRLTASGTFFSGYQPVIGTEGTSADATAVDYTKGFFDCTTMSIGGDDVVINNFEVELKRDEKVMRFLTMKMDKDHVEYAEKRRNKLNKTA